MIRRCITVIAVGLAMAAVPASAQARHRCGTIYAESLKRELTVWIYRGRVSCEVAEMTEFDLWSGTRQGPYCVVGNEACRHSEPTDGANSYWKVNGWRCGEKGTCWKGRRLSKTHFPGYQFEITVEP